MKVYVTKYALTSGIQEMDGEICKDVSISMIRVKGTGRMLIDQHFHGKDWHTTKEAAIARAEEMRKSKIASLQKSIKKLQGMTFE